MNHYRPATQPTLYFIGVTTAKSSIMKVFPAWASALGLRDAVIKGIDFPLHAEGDAYREAVSFIKSDPLSLGALVTTHKIDLFKACRDLFDVLDPHASLMEETSCISKGDGRLICHAKDPISSGLAIDAFLEPGHFARTGGELFAMGAGGSTIAITWHLMRREHGQDVPARIVVADRSQKRLDEIRRIHRCIESQVPVEYVLIPDATRTGAAPNDRILASLKPASLVINATGLGKDAPGSPLTGGASWPERGIAWDLNYRGDLTFLAQARRRQADRHLRVEDGWIYFIHGWTQVIAEVFGISIPTSGEHFEALSKVAAEATKP